MREGYAGCRYPPAPVSLKKQQRCGEMAMKSSVSVLIIYEDASTQQKAVAFCDNLVRRFWTECEFDPTWGSCALLSEPESAAAMADKALAADWIVFALRPTGEPPEAVADWIHSWLPQRQKREGALIALLDNKLPVSCEPATRQVFLRHVAHAAGMDYLTQEPDAIVRPIPDSLDSYNDRAERVTTLLDEILHTQPAPSHLLA